MLEWHDAVLKQKNSPLHDSDVSRINVLAAASIAVEKGNDPIRWFVACVRKNFEYVTQTAEDAAHATLKRIRKQQNGGVSELFGQLLESTKPEEAPELDDLDDFEEGGDE